MPKTAGLLKKPVIAGIVDYLLITFGTILMTVGVYFFKIPNGFVTGGVSGIGTILGKAIPFISSGQWIMIINVLLLVVGFIVLGKMNSIKTVYCSLLFSFSTYICELVVPISAPLTDQPLLELVYAMLLTSAGSAILFNNNASTGGTDIVALILKKYSSLDIGKALLVTDFIVASCSFFTFGIEAGLFSLLGLFAKAFLVDSIIESINSCKYFIVITEKKDEISKYIMTELHHGATVTEGVGSYTETKKYMIHTVCKRIEAVRLRHTIKKIDPHSFIVITTTSEIVGRGFRSI
ncbi:MAG: YitT family protein [Clostridia bacterium]|nr:YitT family protein [Clostridia bacterium]